MNFGLCIFVVVLVLDVLGVLLDLNFLLHGAPTITGFVRSGTVGGCAVGDAILLLNLIGVAGLAWHFFGVKS